MAFHLYDVPGYDRPLRLSEDHAKRIKATRHNPDAKKVDGNTDDPKGK